MMIPPPAPPVLHSDKTRTGDWFYLKGNFKNADEMTEILRAFSCWEGSIEKILNTLSSGKKYHCMVDPHWFRKDYSELKRKLSSQGVSITVHMMSLEEKTPLSED